MVDTPPDSEHALHEHHGGCHCGAVRYRVMAPSQVEVEDCNCSICRKSAYLHLLVPASHFTLLAGDEALITYTFNTGVARHTFCRHCGVKSFYVPRSNPDGYSVNLRCLDTRKLTSVSVHAFDGQHWELHGPALKSRTAP